MEKKTKLTISGSAKKSIKNIEIAKTQGKNSVVIEKKSKFTKSGSYKPGVNKSKSTSVFSKGSFNKPVVSPKSSPIINDFDQIDKTYLEKLSSMI